VTCPNRQCAKEIPEDSLYCDICGKALRKCPKCGKLSTGHFCSADGEPTDALAGLSPEAPKAGPAPQQVSPPVQNATVRATAPAATALVLLHAGGDVLKVTVPGMVGRKEGPLANYLGNYGTVSGRHGQVMERAGKWYYKDVGSTNGSRLNGKACAVNEEYELHQGDILELSDQKFQVG